MENNVVIKGTTETQTEKVVAVCRECQNANSLTSFFGIKIAVNILNVISFYGFKCVLYVRGILRALRIFLIL